MRKKKNIFSAILALAMVVCLTVSLLPTQTVEAADADKTANIDGFSAEFVADPDTSEDDHIFNGTPAEDGKIWTDKSVTTGAIYGVAVDEENFGVALSAMAQTYNTVETGVSTQETKIAYDVVFVLDFSGSMNDAVSKNSSTAKAQAMVDALNPAIVTLMENADSRIAVVGYSGTNATNTDNATTLLSLDHYGTTSTKYNEETKKYDKVYFEYTTKDGNKYIQTVSGVTNSVGNSVSASKRVNGGTPTQRGIYRGMDLLQNTAKPNDKVTRIPIIVLLSDGAAGSATNNYSTVAGGTLYQGKANGDDWSTQDDEVGAYTVLTANYAKTTIDTLYKSRYDYSGIIDKDKSAARFYTIGLGITNNSWTHFMLNPESGVATSDSTANSMRTILAKDATYGSSYDYADKYYGGENMTDDQLKEAFEDIVNDLQVSPQVSSTINDPITSETSGSATGTSVRFTDYLGYKMELKGDYQYLRYGGVNYRFDKQSDNTYKFSGYNQAGETVTGPVITKNNVTYTLADVIFKAEWADETYNGQTGYWKITWEFPSALLPTYSRVNDYDNTDLDPIRMLYEVGLTEDTDLTGDGLKIDADGNLLAADAATFAQYVFHTNLYDYSTPKAMTWSEYTPASDNPFYYETGYTTDSAVAGTTTPYIRLDMVASSSQVEKIEGTANIKLENVRVSLSNAKATFTYNGTEYTVDLSGSRQNNASWVGEVSIPVTGTTAGGEQVTANVSAKIEAKYVKWYDYYRYLELSGVTIGGQTATLETEGSGFNQTTNAILNNFTISVEGETTVASKSEVVSVYMELKQDTDGYYVQDANGKRIDVTPEDGNYKIVLGGETYYSTTYYKYKSGTESYVEKELAKGTVAKSLVGQFIIDQPEGTDFKLTESNLPGVFQYRASNGTLFKATGILFPDGSKLGTVGDPSTNLPPAGTFKVCVDGIKNGLIDVNGNPMVVHFDFIVEAQTLASGGTRYVVLDCSYWDSGDKYAVDVIVSDTPEIDETTGNYTYDVSYTIKSKHASGKANVTQTDPHFFHSDFTNGQMMVRLGNNGRVSVDISNAYKKAVTVEKHWRNRLGEELSVNDALLKDISITVGLYQEYKYTTTVNGTEAEVVQEGTSGTPFATVELNQANSFTYTWATPTLPAYLVTANGDYVLDKDGKQVPVTYVVGEVSGAAGWTLAEPEEEITDSEDTFILTNVPLTQFSPSVEKKWTVDGAVTNAPEGYKVKVELLANGESVIGLDKLDTQHEIVAVLSQTNASSDAELSVTFGGTKLTPESQEVHQESFIDADTVEYTFAYDQSVGGEPGSGSYAYKADITITISKTSGDKLGISDAKVTYYYQDYDTKENKTATLHAYRTSSAETDTTKTAIFLMSYTNEKKAIVTLDGTEDTPWTYAWSDWNLPLLAKDEDGQYKAIVYTICETLLVPDGNGGYTEYTPDENGLIQVGDVVYKAISTNDENYHFTLTNDKGLTSISAEKVWVDNDNAYTTRPDKITFKLLADSKEVSGAAKEITSTNAFADVWNEVESAKVVWENVPLYNTETGKEIVYTVEEVIGTLPTSDQYKIEVTADAENEGHFIVTNSLYADPAINSTIMEVEKVWIDDNDAAGKRPDNLYMVLYRAIDAADGNYVWEVVPNVSVITLNDITLTGKWEGLAKYNEQGEKWIYSVREFASLTRSTEGVEGYVDVSEESDKTETKYTFRNRLEDGSISKTVTKVWKDKALESARPANVTVVLSGKTTDGNAVDLTQYVPTQTLTASSWSYTWSNLPEYSGGMKIDYTITETKVGDTEVTENKAGMYAVTVQDDGTGNDFTIVNTLTDETTVAVTKEWKNTPEGFEIPTVTFDIYSNYGGKQNAALTVSKDKLTDSVTLPKYNAEGDIIYYTLEEQTIVLPDGADYKIESVIGSNTGVDGNYVYEAVNTYVTLVQDISGTKTWVGVTGNNIPENITIALYRQVGEGEKELVTGVTPTWTDKDGTEWTYTYTNLPIYANDNTETPYIYSVVETEVDGTAVANTDYTATVNGLNITNTLGGTINGADLDGTKTWVNVTETNVPDSIQVELLRKVAGGALEKAVDINGNQVGTITVQKTGQSNVMAWTYDFTGVTLPKYDGDGNAYVYSVKEISVTADDTTRNVVYADDVNGTVGDYAVTLSGLNITNKLDDESEKDKTVEYTVKKEWSVPSGTALPAEITVALYRTVPPVSQNAPELVESKTMTGNGSSWTYTFTDLRKYTDDGITEFVYSVKEVKVGKEDVVEANDTMTAGEYTVHIYDNVIVNSRDIDFEDIKVTKKWVNVEAANLPDSVKVQLYQNDVAFGNPVDITKTANATADSMTWEYTFSNLPVSSDGTEAGKYTYTVKEVSVTAEGVTEAVDRDLLTVGDYTVTENGLTIKNTLKQGDDKNKTQYPVIKNWIDADGQIPDSITVQLMKDGQDEGTAVKLTAANNADSSDEAKWTYTFTSLRKYTDNGITQYVYTAKETYIEDTAVSNGKAGDFFVTYVQQDKETTIINNRLAGSDKELINYPVEKKWLDANGNTLTESLPQSITVELYQKDSAKVDVLQATQTFGASDGWKYTFTGLRRYEDDGLTPYSYYAKETKAGDAVVVTDGTVSVVGDYIVSVADTANGSTITNKLFGAKTSITVTKKWVDVAGKNIPDAITIELIGGDDSQYVTLKKDDFSNESEWKYTFTNLPVYKQDGITKRTYTIREKNITAGNTTTRVVYTGDTGIAGDYVVTLDNSDYVIINTLKKEDEKDKTVDYTVTKKWDVPAGTKLPVQITVELYRSIPDPSNPGNGLNPELVETKVMTGEGDTWTHTFTGLRKYTDNGITEYIYTVKETKVGETEVNNENIAGDYIVTVNGSEITNTFSQDKVDVKITKVWEGVSGSNIPNITVQLLQNGVAYGNEVTLAANLEGVTVVGNQWYYTFKDLPEHDSDNRDYVYTVRELKIGGIAIENGKVGDYVSKAENGNAENEFTITNTLTGTITEIAGKKTWKDAAEEKERPKEITVELYRTIAGGAPEKVGELEVKADWTFKFDNAGNGYPKYDAAGNLYTYSVKEKDEADNWITYGDNRYIVEYGKDGDVYTIKNTLYDEYNPDDDTAIKVTKVWLDDNNSQQKRPESLNVSLKLNGETLETITLTGSMGTVSGNGVSGNGVSGNGVSGNGVSGNNGSGNGSILNVWAKYFAGTYPMYDAEGQLLAYTVEEVTITDYTLKEGDPTGNAADGFVLTNIYTPGQTTITVEKVWVDNNNALQARPDTLTLKLFQNGAEYRTVELKATDAGTWTATVNVPLADAEGKMYTYTVKEPESEVEGTDYVAAVNGYTVTNTLDGTVHVQGTKSWNKIDPEYRPESVTVELWRKAGDANQVPVTNADGSTMTITTNAAADWKYDFGTLDKYDENGALYTYIVKETMVGQTPIEDSDYEASGNGYDLTNAIKEETRTAITVKGTKIWVDNNDEYKMRPESITVNLIRDGEKVASMVVKAADDGTWSYEFKDLPKYDMDNGKLYTYSVTEDAVENYFTEVNGYDIVNKLDESKIPKDPEPEVPTEPSEPDDDDDDDDEPDNTPDQNETVINPPTGDSNSIWGFVLLGIAGIAVIIVAIILRRRDRK